jgi:hypothetical protein
MEFVSIQADVFGFYVSDFCLMAEDREIYFLLVFPALTFAHRARCAAAILLRPAAEIVRLFATGIAADPRLLPCM